ncbi:beta-propeller domain-containing protein [Actinomadura oligospora]|uniref:beta-propeller domain-containing protein n=1 Tax=Actinomadura oligospora TaxID=111804 RepID=UPI0004B2C745|nr:beta-propeller domain-containing protein [Actinomadura oligospora]
MAATLTLTACASSPIRSGPLRPPPLKLVAYDSCDALLHDLRESAPQTPGPVAPQPPGRVEVPDGTGDAYAAAPAPNGPAHSGTNTYEPDADEPDTVKTDGRRIVTLAGNRLHIIDAASRTLTARLSLPEAQPGSFTGHDGQLLLSGDRALVISSRTLFPPPGVITPRASTPDTMPPRPRVQTILTLVDLPGIPKVVGTMTVNGSYVDARQTGSTIRLVVRSTPSVAVPLSTPQNQPRDPSPPQRPRLDDWLPTATVTAPGVPQKQYQEPCDQVKRPSAPTGGGLLSVLTVDPAKGFADPQPISVLGDGQTVYGNGKTLYVAGSSFGGPGRTHLHRFDVGGSGRPRWVASGVVQGTLLNQYALSEYQGVLRVATTAGDVSGISTFTRRGDRLTQIGRLGGLGRNERLYAVRYLGRIAYAVTFRQVDPLYELDLGDPEHPRSLGELKVDGFSSYLHPTPDGHLIGVGQNVTGRGTPTGTLVSEFDGSTPPRRIASHTEKGRLPSTGMDPHAFLYWPATGLTVIPTQPIGAPSPPGGAVALTIDARGIRPAGFIRQDLVSRAVVVGDTLWTFSDQGALASGLTDLRKRAWLGYA